MGDPRGEMPVLPDDADVELNDEGWVEFTPEEAAALSDAEAEEQQHLKQRHHKLYRPVDSGEDERGPYDVIPLSMVRGGQAKPTPVHRDPMKHLVLDQTIQPRTWYKSKIENDRTRPRPCLLPNSQVQTPWGDKAIKDLRVGDIVLGYDIEHKKVAQTYVQGVADQTKPEYLELELGNGRVLRLTPEHLVYTHDWGWTQAEDLKVGQLIQGVEDLPRLLSVRWVPKETSVHDIQTGTGNFFAEGVLVHNCYTEALLTSPYGGYCPVGCAFCYINNGSRGYRSTGIPTADPDYPEKYHAWLKKCMIAGAGYMTSFSEAFHPLEDTYHITQRLTNVFVEEGLPIFYCSRKLPAEWAIEALQKNPYSYMQWSINTSNPADFRKLSPGAAKLEDMLRYMERMSKLGIYISIQCNPINAGITTLPELVELVRMLSQAGANHVIFKFVEQVANTRNVIIDRLKARRFDKHRIELMDRMFNQVIGGVYTIQQDIRVAWLKELLVATREHGITMSTCYEYYEDGKGGANLAPYFTTSDQCHGRGIPVHYRPAPGEKFQPLPGCFRKGCLYCAEHGTRACRNERLQQATALDYSDLRNTVITGRESDWDLAGSCARPEDEPNSINRNPEFLTDAEMWGWPPLEQVVELGQKGPRPQIDMEWVQELM